MRLQNSLLALVLSTLIIPIGAEARYGSMSSAGASAARSSSSLSSSARVSARTTTSPQQVSSTSRRTMVQNNNLMLMGVGMATTYAILHSSDPKDYCANKLTMVKYQVRIPCIRKSL